MPDPGSTGSTGDGLTNGREPGEPKTYRPTVDQQRVRQPIGAQTVGLASHLNTPSTDDFISYGPTNDTNPTGRKKGL